MANRHVPFIARTIIVRNGDVDQAARMLNRILGREGIIDQYRMTRYYEKPTQQRRRINYEKCKSIFNEDLSRKMRFIMRKNRTEPFPGSL